MAKKLSNNKKKDAVNKPAGNNDNCLQETLDTNAANEDGMVAKNAGYIAFKDKKVVLFYSNDLATTPSKPVLTYTDAEAIDSVHGVAEVKRWLGNEHIGRTSLLVPAVIVAYNLYMNSVD